jgi:hypothetical protein
MSIIQHCLEFTLGISIMVQNQGVMLAGDVECEIPPPDPPWNQVALA